MPIRCYCCSNQLYKDCCQPIIENQTKAKTAQGLMQSRFSAYVLKNYQYIFNTYAQAQQEQLTLDDLASSASDTHWLSLKVINHHSQLSIAQVEFKAYYKVDQIFYVMHELSEFVLENDQWRYTTGVIQQDSGEIKPQRNSPCLCNSGQKFKKCCGK